MSIEIRAGLMVTALLMTPLVVHNATVIDGTGSAPQSAVDIVITGETIAALTTCAHPAGARVIDVTGKYVVPGFIDMHAHLQERVRDDKGELTPRVDWALTRRMLSMLLDHGVTTVRDPGAPTEAAVALRGMVNDGRVEGPRIFTAGRILNASSFNEEPFQPVRTAAEIGEEIAWQAAAGVDFIKIYGSMPPDLAKVAIDAAHAKGLPVIGHLQRTTWTQGARLGIDSIEHGAPWSPQYLSEADRAGYQQTMFGRVYWLDHLDLKSAAVREMVSELARNGVVVDPTLIAYHTKFFGDQPRWRANEDNRLMPERVLAGWRAGNFTRDWTPEQYAAARAVWPKQLALTKALFDGGVTLTVGTDMPTAWIVPGASFHEEMALLRDAGIPPLEIIRMATLNAAAALGREKELGTVQPGRAADLVVLDRNPLEKIENTRSIHMVIQRGKVVR